MTIDSIKQNGVVGAGGAGFPSHVKLNSNPEFLIMNAAECEPLLHKDKELLRHHAEEVLSGFKTAMEITGAKQGIIGIKEKYTDLIRSLSPKMSGNMRIQPIGDFYPAGDEVTLVQLITGRIIQPGKLPLSVGCVVMNVETLLNIGRDLPVTDKYLTVAGAVKTPLSIRVPVGTSYAEILARFEITAPNYAIRSGGLMMGTLEKDPDQVVTKTTGGLIILPGDHYCVTLYKRFETPHETVRIAKAGCDQCSFCTEFCPRYLLGHPVRPETAMRNRMFSREEDEMVHNGNAFCCECNLCTFYSCPEGLDPKGATVIEKRSVSKNGEKWEGLPVKGHPMMEFRKVPTSKLMQRLDVHRFQNKGPLSDLAIQPKFVRIPLKQHAGTPAAAVVSKGENVQKGDLIARASGKLSANIHASIDGKITSVDDKEIVVQR